MNTNFDPDRDKALGITGGPPPKEKRGGNWLMPFAFVGPIVLAAVLTFVVLTSVGGEREPAEGGDRSDSVRLPSPAVVDPNPGLNKSQLKGLADAVARAWYVDADAEKAQFIIQNANVVAEPCRVFVTSGFHALGDFADKANRVAAKKLAERVDALIAFDKTDGRWTAAAQTCN